jgi:hypothetical protein
VLAALVLLAGLLLSLLLITGQISDARVEAQTAPPDADGDGITDEIEQRYGSDPNSPRSRPEHLEFDALTGSTTCADAEDNDLDGATDGADSGCVAVPTATLTTVPTATATATTPPRATPTPTATIDPPIQQPTPTPTQPSIDTPPTTPGPDPTAPGPGTDVTAPEQPTQQPGFGLPEPPDLRITDVEFTQGIQDLGNRMPLV